MGSLYIRKNAAKALLSGYSYNLGMQYQDCGGDKQTFTLRLADNPHTSPTGSDEYLLLSELGVV